MTDSPAHVTRPALTQADSDFAVFCEQGAFALDLFTAMFAAPAQRVHTGYMPKQQRNAVAHGLYSMGVRKPPTSTTAADRALSEARAWGLAS